MMSNDLMAFNFFKKVKSPFACFDIMDLWQKYELCENSGGFLEIKCSWLDVGNNENEKTFFVAMDAKDLILSYLQDGDFEKADEFGQLLEDAHLSRRCQSRGREFVPKLSDFEGILGGVILIGEGGEMVGPWRVVVE